MVDAVCFVLAAPSNHKCASKASNTGFLGGSSLKGRGFPSVKIKRIPGSLP
jgi:hypothetical protein